MPVVRPFLWRRHETWQSAQTAQKSIGDGYAVIVGGYRAFYDTFAPKAQMVVGNLEEAALLLGLEPEVTLDEVRIELAKTSFTG